MAGSARWLLLQLCCVVVLLQLPAPLQRAAMLALLEDRKGWFFPAAKRILRLRLQKVVPQSLSIRLRIEVTGLQSRKAGWPTSLKTIVSSESQSPPSWESASLWRPCSISMSIPSGRVGTAANFSWDPLQSFWCLIQKSRDTHYLLALNTIVSYVVYTVGICIHYHHYNQITNRNTY